ncbi:hypothetical protein HAX54_040397 [Datura stramonium]|uniref:Exostosin GT47 domain-containing protein n=1 Tax=Datura stramonium TaxID=4076 RepID=A0ABS8RRN5_DATST|nr:hypothetical protein [Datura stramonium]
MNISFVGSTPSVNTGGNGNIQKQRLVELNGGNYASESYFKKVLVMSHFITKDPFNANLFFLPFSIARLRHDPRVGIDGIKDFIKSYIFNISHEYPYWNQTNGADHFYVACHSIGRFAMEKVIDVKINAIQVVCSSSYFVSAYIPHKDASLPQIWPRLGGNPIRAPYKRLFDERERFTQNLVDDDASRDCIPILSAVLGRILLIPAVKGKRNIARHNSLDTKDDKKHFPNLLVIENKFQQKLLLEYIIHNFVCHVGGLMWRKEGILHVEKFILLHAFRKKLGFFAGSLNSPVREKLLEWWGNDSDIFVHFGRVKRSYAEELLDSKFCLHVKGYEVNTARIADALFYGCVPVIIANHYDLPFADILDWKYFSVIVATLDIPLLKKILQGITQQEYLVLQSNVLKVREHFQWHVSPVDFDAFYMVMYELWLRRTYLRLQ